VVVDLVGEPAHGLLAESRFVERKFLPGGEHNMYELAFALAASGHPVELRGWLDRRAFDRLKAAVGVAPATDLAPRLPTSSDVVVIPEGWRDPLEYVRMMLSPARLAIFLLAPPGLFGWPFCSPGWSPPDPLTVPLDQVAAPEHFAAMHRLGFSLLTHSRPLADAVSSAGAPCTYVGVGRPSSTLPDAPSTRSVDVAALIANRWAPLVSEVIAGLGDVTVDLIEEVPNDEVLARLGQSHILLWPSRIEGHATIPWEARLVGCVPVALSTNRFAVGLEEESGSVVVDRVEDLNAAVHALLSEPERWRALSQRAVTSARRAVDWDAYVGRVDAWLRGLPARGPEAEARAGMGDAVLSWQRRRAAESQSALEELQGEVEYLRAALQDTTSRLEVLRNRRAVRTALRLAAARHRLLG
jgi:hypothetical protein